MSQHCKAVKIELPIPAKNLPGNKCGCKHIGLWYCNPKMCRKNISRSKYCLSLHIVHSFFFFNIPTWRTFFNCNFFLTYLISDRKHHERILGLDFHYADTYILWFKLYRNSKSNWELHSMQRVWSFLVCCLPAAVALQYENKNMPLKEKYEKTTQTNMKTLLTQILGKSFGSCWILSKVLKLFFPNNSFLQN